MVCAHFAEPKGQRKTDEAKSPVIAQAAKRGKLQTKFGSVFCNDGDVVLAVRWLDVTSQMPSAGRSTNRATRTRLAE